MLQKEHLIHKHSKPTEGLVYSEYVNRHRLYNSLQQLETRWKKIYIYNLMQWFLVGFVSGILNKE